MAWGCAGAFSHQYGIIHGRNVGLERTPVFEDFLVIGYQVSSSANALVTDSAASGTALPAAVKQRVLGQDAEGIRLCQQSCLAGWQGGRVLTSVTLDHATPAAYASYLRTHYDTIVEQAFQSGLTVLGGNRPAPRTLAKHCRRCTGNGWNLSITLRWLL